MWRIVTVLGLLLCCAATAAGPAEYRFQPLIDRDQSAQTGMLSAVAEQAGKTLVTAEVTEPGYALEDHFR